MTSVTRPWSMPERGGTKMGIRPKSGWWQGNCPADPWPVPKRVRKENELLVLHRVIEDMKTKEEPTYGQ